MKSTLKYRTYQVSAMDVLTWNSKKDVVRRDSHCDSLYLRIKRIPNAIGNFILANEIDTVSVLFKQYHNLDFIIKSLLLSECFN